MDCNELDSRLSISFPFAFSFQFAYPFGCGGWLAGVFSLLSVICDFLKIASLALIVLIACIAFAFAVEEGAGDGIGRDLIEKGYLNSARKYYT